MRFYTNSRHSVPSAWETLATAPRSQVALGYLKVDALRLKYVGPGEDDRQAASIIANHPAPADCPLFYFEIEVLSKGREGFIGIGLQTDDVALARLPGWEPRSYGYHGDDGFVFCGSGRGQAYGPQYTTGDTIGVLLHRGDKTISFFKNGTPLGVAFSNVTEERLHPCVGLRTVGEEVVANFGGQPFKADFEAVVAAFKEQVLRNVAAMPLPMTSSRGLPLLPQLLHDHLLHHRCSETAAIIARDLLRGQGEASSSGQTNGFDDTSTDSSQLRSADMCSRQLIFELVSQGRIEEAVQQVEQRYTRAPLDNNPALDFRLKVAQFCQQLRGQDAGSMEAALAYGRQVLAPHQPKSAADEELLSEALSLLAYEKPETSPCGHLLGQEARNSLAEALNGAILKQQGLPSVSPLERIFQQAALTLSELHQSNHPQALALDLHRAVLGPTRGAGSGWTGGRGGTL